MTKLVSMDLRERAMTRVAAGEGVRVVAMALSVAPWSVVKWSHRLRATGSAAPGGIGGHVPPEIVDDHKAWLIERVLQAFARAAGRMGRRAGGARSAGGLSHDVEIRARAGSELQKNGARQRAGPPRSRAQARALEGAAGQR